MKNWMKDAVPKANRGKFSDKAAKAGKSVSEYAGEKASAPGVLGKEARLAKVFQKEAKKK